MSQAFGVLNQGTARLLWRTRPRYRGSRCGTVHGCRATRSPSDGELRAAQSSRRSSQRPPLVIADALSLHGPSPQHPQHEKINRDADRERDQNKPFHFLHFGTRNWPGLI
jgi:hypothetical protein